MMKLVTLFFDVEDQWERPYRANFEFKGNLQRVLEILNKYQIRAVFNVCGIVAEFYPQLIAKLSEEGHEIASHGYLHENFTELEPGELNDVLEKAEEVLQDIIAEKLVGIRSPWLLYNEEVYSVIEKRGYKWVSNLHTSHPELLHTPDKKQNFAVKNITQEIVWRLRWRNFKKDPFQIGRLIEIPLLSSTDGELLGKLSPLQKSSENRLNFALESLKKQFARSQSYFNLNFHLWIIGSTNRVSLLDKILDYTSNQMKCSFVLARQIINRYF